MLFLSDTILERYSTPCCIVSGAPHDDARIFVQFIIFLNQNDREDKEIHKTYNGTVESDV